MTYFDQINPINDTFDQGYDNKLDRNNFWDSFKKERFSSHHKILTYDVILAPKMTPFWQFSPKMTYFDKIYAINDIFDHISVHKSDWNNS